MRARRLVAVATVAVGLVALTGCRTEPGVAAYIGDHRVTEDQVTSILDELRDGLSASPATAGQADALLPGRDQVVATLVLRDVCRELSADKGYQPQGQVSAAQVAQQTGMPADAVYPQRVAEFSTCMSGVPAGEQVAPTQAELAAVIAAGRSTGDIPANVTDEEAATQLDGDQLRSALATRKVLADAIGGYDVSVNPRYRPLLFPLLSFKGGPAVSVPLGEAGSAVTEISTPEPESTEPGSAEPSASVAP
ncbi:hypothetical protein ACFFMM_05120 [Micromonospora chaiyaphumensis]|uniref:SurA N-terminal domain-containing protein n=1 Tax=Micromonospora chaiyaphumensis TaxID=307119 RepID=A0A1C4VAV4_9ACTN|nr:hypothetical protein [Micromonospora chaiyaphumensis]SCE80899.1 hypothetical protein GA0070214_102177 [Micromonospora chaiyaphumensis]